MLDPLPSRADCLVGRFLRAKRVQTETRRPFPDPLLSCLDLPFSGIKSRLPIVREAFALVGQPLAFIGQSFPHIGRLIALIGDRVVPWCCHSSSLGFRNPVPSRPPAIRACGA